MTSPRYSLGLRRAEGLVHCFVYDRHDQFFCYHARQPVALCQAVLDEVVVLFGPDVRVYERR